MSLAPRPRFNSLPDILAHAERTLAARPRAAAAWTPAQNVSHVARAINASRVGLDADVRTPLPARLLGRLVKKRVLARGLPTGRAVPGGEQSSLVPPADIAPGAALAELRAAVQDAVRGSMTVPHPFFGPLTHAEWTQFHCRHAELHFGNILTGDSSAP